jgi:hypothetical protein
VAMGRVGADIIQKLCSSRSVPGSEGFERAVPFAWVFGWPVLRLRLCANGEYESSATSGGSVQKGPC